MENKVMLSVFSLCAALFLFASCTKSQNETMDQGTKAMDENPAAMPAPTADHPAAAPGKDGAVIEQTTCPVMQGNPINKNIFVDYKGRRIYFCCPACPPAFNKDPEKYLKILDAGKNNSSAVPAPAAEQVANTVCPVMGGPVNPELYAEVNGRKIFVCCKGCIKTIQDNPEKYLKKL